MTLRIDVLIQNPVLGKKYTAHYLPRNVRSYILTQGGEGPIVLESFVEFHKISSPTLGLLVARWTLRSLISRQSTVEYRIYYR